MTRLNQTITRWQGMGLIATTLLGTGVFILPQLTLQAAGDKAIWAWGFLLLAILPLTLVFAELGRHYTHAAGPAYFTEKAFGALPGRVIGLIFLFAIPPGAAAALIMTFEFLKPLISLTPFQTLMAEMERFLLSVSGQQERPPALWSDSAGSDTDHTERRLCHASQSVIII